MKRILAIILLSASLPGCPDKKPVESPALPKPAYQRFVPIAPIPTSSFLDFALDTKTGQLCKTWVGQLLPVNERTFNLSGLPLCLDLYVQYPDEKMEGSSLAPGTRKINSSGDTVMWDGKQWKLVAPAR